MWDYSDKVKEHFFRPRNVGEIEDADAVGDVGSISCGDALRLSLKIDPKTGTILDAKFKTFGCGSAIASASILTELVKGKTIEEAQKITNDDIAKELDGLPPEKMHCSVMGQDALKAAIANYRGEEYQHVENPEENIICHCFGVTEAKIRQIIIDHKLTTVEEVTNYTKAGGGCGNCVPDIQKILDEINATKIEEPKKEEKRMSTIEKIHLIEDTVDKKIRPLLQMHGGDIKLIDVEGNNVKVELTGACAGCGHAMVTLKGFVERALHELVDPNLVVVDE